MTKTVNDVEYHYVICYVVPNPEGGYRAAQRSGTCQPKGRTRSEMFEAIGQLVADEDGITFADFSVTFFSLEPNQLVIAAYPPVDNLDPECVDQRKR